MLVKASFKFGTTIANEEAHENVSQRTAPLLATNGDTTTTDNADVTHPRASSADVITHREASKASWGCYG